MRVLGRLGIRAAILTNAAGAINLDYSQGALVVIRDHINLQGTNPLIGPNDSRFGSRFPDMTHAYSNPYREIALAEAKRLRLKAHEGVYAALAGPSFETPAEIRYLRTIGADLVGMSTVPEVIVARQMGVKVLGISCVTNMAAGILDRESITPKSWKPASAPRPNSWLCWSLSFLTLLPMCATPTHPSEAELAFPDVFLPDICMLANVVRHHRDALCGIQFHNAYA